jgi:hypothetical protein
VIQYEEIVPAGGYEARQSRRLTTLPDTYPCIQSKPTVPNINASEGPFIPSARRQLLARVVALNKVKEGAAHLGSYRRCQTTAHFVQQTIGPVVFRDRSVTE